jgi:hypothetical protein
MTTISGGGRIRGIVVVGRCENSVCGWAVKGMSEAGVCCTGQVQGGLQRVLFGGKTKEEKQAIWGRDRLEVTKAWKQRYKDARKRKKRRNRGDHKQASWQLCLLP